MLLFVLEIYMPMKNKIEFEASIEKIQTMQDGAIRLTLDLSESCIQQAAELMECKMKGMTLFIRADKIDNDIYREYSL